MSFALKPICLTTKVQQKTESVFRQLTCRLEWIEVMVLMRRGAAEEEEMDAGDVDDDGREGWDGESLNVGDDIEASCRALPGSGALTCRSSAWRMGRAG